MPMRPWATCLPPIVAESDSEIEFPQAEHQPRDLAGQVPAEDIGLTDDQIEDWRQIEARFGVSSAAATSKKKKKTSAPPDVNRDLIEGRFAPCPEFSSSI